MNKLSKKIIEEYFYPEFLNLPLNKFVKDNINIDYFLKLFNQYDKGPSGIYTFDANIFNFKTMGELKRKVTYAQNRINKKINKYNMSVNSHVLTVDNETEVDFMFITIGETDSENF